MASDIVAYPLPAEKVQKIKNGLRGAEYVGFLPSSDDLVVADKDGRSLKIYNPNGQFCKDLVQRIKPTGLATKGYSHYDGMFAVTDECKRVKVFRFNDKSGDPSPGELFSEWDEARSWKPRDLVFCHNGTLVVTNTYETKQSVGIYTLDGKQMRSFGSEGSGDDQFKNPLYVTVDRFERILVSDNGNHCIKLFDCKGRYLSKIGQTGRGPGCLCQPHGVCTDPMGNIFVCDTGNKRVAMFAPTGQYIQDILTSSEFPFDIAYSKATRRLAVSQYGSASGRSFKKIRIYKLGQLSPVKRRT